MVLHYQNIQPNNCYTTMKLCNYTTLGPLNLILIQFIGILFFIALFVNRDINTIKDLTPLCSGPVSNQLSKKFLDNRTTLYLNTIIITIILYTYNQYSICPQIYYNQWTVLNVYAYIMLSLAYNTVNTIKNPFN